MSNEREMTYYIGEVNDVKKTWDDVLFLLTYRTGSGGELVGQVCASLSADKHIRSLESAVEWAAKSMLLEDMTESETIPIHTLRDYTSEDDPVCRNICDSLDHILALMAYAHEGVDSEEKLRRMETALEYYNTVFGVIPEGESPYGAVSFRGIHPLMAFSETDMGPYEAGRDTVECFLEVYRSREKEIKRMRCGGSKDKEPC